MSDSFSTKLDLSLKDKLQNDLIEQGFEITTPPYTIFSAKKHHLTCILYTSGSLVVQGKNKKEFIEFYLEPEILKNLSFTNPEINYEEHIGVDESGKGDFFGPLVVVGVCANKAQIEELINMGVKDSKKLSDASMTKKAPLIKKLCPHDIMVLKPEKYNELYSKFNNLNLLLAWAHATIIETLSKETGCKYAISDQFASSKSLLENRIKIDLKLEQRHHAEEDVVVAAASILAKNAFIESLEKIGSEFNVKLPKGSSSPDVIKIATKLVAIHGEAILLKIAKKHFKISGQIIA